MIELSAEVLTTLLRMPVKQPYVRLGYLLNAVAKSAMMSDRKKLLMLWACAWLFANKSTIPYGIVIEVRR